jgi:hypothetical protein
MKQFERFRSHLLTHVRKLPPPVRSQRLVQEVAPVVVHSAPSVIPLWYLLLHLPWILLIGAVGFHLFRQPIDLESMPLPLFSRTRMTSKHL